MLIISHVVALSNNNVIGVDNNLPWNLKKDLQHFKDYTSNKIIVMGRKTYESIGRPLPNRVNYVVSNTINEIKGAYIFKSTLDAIEAAKQKCLEDDSYKEIVIIGGGYLFRETLSLANKLVLTQVDCNIDGDVFYPEIEINSWNEVATKGYKKDSENDFDFIVKVLEKN